MTQGVKTLLKMLQDGNEVIQMLCAWCLTNLSSDSTQNQVAMGKLGGIEACLLILQTCDNNGTTAIPSITVVCVCVCSIISTSDDGIADLLGHHLDLDLYDDGFADVLEKTLWLITNMSLIPANRRQMHAVGYLSALCNLLTSSIQLQVIDVLRNILQDRTLSLSLV